MKRLLAPCLGLLLTTAMVIAPTTTARADDSGKLLLVLDASGSMAEPAADGRTRIEAARTALSGVVENLPTSAQVGMRVYGASVDDQADPKSCEDTELVVPIGTDNRDALTQQINEYEPFGWTPTSHALEQAAADLGGEGKRSILLISDGEETCVPDPCPVAEKIAADGIDLRIDVVGFQVSGKAREQLSCIADTGNGTYYDAEDTDDLTETLRQVEERAVRDVDVVGTPVVGTETENDAPVLTPGDWTDTVPAQDQTKHYRITRQQPGSTLWAALSFRSKAGDKVRLELELIGPAGEDCGGAVASVLFNHGGDRGDLVKNSVLSDLRRDACTEGDLTLSIAPADHDVLSTAEGGEPVQITVIEEPPVSDVSVDVGYQTPEWTEMSATNGPSLQGGTTTVNAPVLQPGTVTGDLVPGEIQFFTVDADWGQRIQAQLDLPGLPATRRVHGS